MGERDLSLQIKFTLALQIKSLKHIPFELIEFEFIARWKLVILVNSSCSSNATATNLIEDGMQFARVKLNVGIPADTK